MAQRNGNVLLLSSLCVSESKGTLSVEHTFTPKPSFLFVHTLELSHIHAPN